jgi:hypothetical protein
MPARSATSVISSPIIVLNDVPKHFRCIALFLLFCKDLCRHVLLLRLLSQKSAHHYYRVLNMLINA